MKSNLIIVFTGLIILSVNTSFKSDNDKWALERKSNDVIVYSRIPEGRNLKEIKSHTTANCKLSTLVAVLADVSNYKNWIYNCIESKKVKKISNNKMLYYTQTNAPWPISNRDLVAYNKVFQDENTKIVHSISVPQPKKLEQNDGVVRITYFYGEWTFTPLKDGDVSIDYYLKIDPAGNIPNWVTNMLIDNGPYQTLIDFKKQLDLPKYQKVKFDFISD